MAKLRGNRLLWASVLAVALYWAVAPLVPNPYLSSFFSLLILVSGTMTLSQYASATLQVVWYGERSQDEQGRGRGAGG